MAGMRTAEVAAVCTVTALAIAASLVALLDHPHPSPTGAGDRSPPVCGVRIEDLPPAQRPAAAEAPPRYGGPVGDQFLSAWSDLLIAKGEGPPMLFVLGARDLNGRYGWRMPRVARLMAEELASVLDDGCASGCSRAAETARTAAHGFVDDGDFDDGDAQTRAWVKDDDGIRTYMHRLTVRSRAAAITVDVTCTCASWTVGMRMWNDATTCDATLREKGHVLAIYRPRVRVSDTKESILEPTEAWDQTVELPGGATLVTETGWDYAGDNVNTPLKKTTPRTGPHWR